MWGLGIGELMLLALAGLALPLFGIVDALRHPEPDWKTSGHSKVTWIALMSGSMLFFFFLVFPVVISAIYLLGVRPSLRRQEHPTS